MVGCGVKSLLVLVAAALMGANALELRPQFPQMGVPGMGVPGMGQMNYPPMGFGGMMPGMGQMAQMPNFGQGFGFGGMPAQQFGFPQQQQPKVPAAAQQQQQQRQQPPLQQQQQQQQQQENAAVPATKHEQMPQVQEMAKWAEMMGMPKISEEDMSKMMEMQNSMIGKLQALPASDIQSMRAQQNELADQMDQLLQKPEPAGVDAFQSKQEELMNEWAGKLGLPPVSSDEHKMMHQQLQRMFEQMSQMPKAELDALRQKHQQVKAMVAAAAASSTNN